LRRAVTHAATGYGEALQKNKPMSQHTVTNPSKHGYYGSHVLYDPVTSYMPQRDKRAVGQSTAGQIPVHLGDAHGTVLYVNTPQEAAEARRLYTEHLKGMAAKLQQGKPTKQGKSEFEKDSLKTGA
jgi:hypothetical protein